MGFHIFEDWNPDEGFMTRTQVKLLALLIRGWSKAVQPCRWSFLGHNPLREWRHHVGWTSELNLWAKDHDKRGGLTTYSSNQFLYAQPYVHTCLMYQRFYQFSSLLIPQIVWNGFHKWENIRNFTNLVSLWYPELCGMSSINGHCAFVCWVTWVPHWV